jgi:hypothetical protein
MILIGAVVVAAGVPSLAVASSTSRAVATTTSSWTTYGGSTSRDSAQINDAPAAPLRVRWTSTSQNGAIYGEPLIDDGRVFVATENNEVEALSARTGRVIWSRSLGTAVPAGDLPCGDITPTVGITSTMVIDPSNSRLFVSAETLVGSTVHHVLVALSLTRGTTVFRRDLDQPGWTANAELQRGALGLDNGRVLMGFGGNYGDCSSYHGYVMAVPETGKGSTLVYRTPSTNQDAIWGPAGMAVDPSGDVYVATGNGASRSTFDMGNAVIKLTSTLKLKSWFAPTGWEADNANDYDLGSTAPVLLPGGHVFEVGKEQTGYLLHADHLGGIGGSVQAINVCDARGGDAYASGYLYLPCPDSGMVALRLVSGKLHAVWHNPSALGSPTIGAGLVWSVSGNKLLGVALKSGAVIDSIAAPVTEHFAAPSIADGLLVIGGASQVTAYQS